ncbi:uncharacterized protein LOC142611924 [Castanea sativa]|uniref:uncharacterized protein LOC142611924 n=1 Tax=Castanea sativa TaxID=21020 RepID=UPI003F64E452
MYVSHVLAEESGSKPKRIKGSISPILGFSDEDKVGTIQPHDDALVVTLRIGGYDVKRVMVDQGSGVDVMYPDLFKGLNLKLEDFTTYDSPLISFEGKVVIPKGQSPIVARPWLHALGVVSSTLHVKVKFPSGGLIEEILGSQSVARQCISAAILHQTEPESSVSTAEDYSN